MANLSDLLQSLLTMGATQHSKDNRLNYADAANAFAQKHGLGYDSKTGKFTGVDELTQQGGNYRSFRADPGENIRALYENAPNLAASITNKVAGVAGNDAMSPQGREANWEKYFGKSLSQKEKADNMLAYTGKKAGEIFNTSSGRQMVDPVTGRLISVTPNTNDVLNGRMAYDLPRPVSPVGSVLSSDYGNAGAGQGFMMHFNPDGSKAVDFLPRRTPNPGFLTKQSPWDFLPTSYKV